MNYSATDIAEAVGGRVCEGTDSALRVRRAFTDSREIEDGGLFVAIRGARIDGHTFVSDMLKNGCLALIDNAEYAMPGCIIVDDTLSALERLAEHYRQTVINGVTVIAVTGSVGKTGTKDMTALAVSAEKRVFKTPGNRNSNIGLPLSVLSVSPDDEVAVLEAGISSPDEMWRLSKVCCPDVAIVTNIGYSHIEAFGTREAIRDEKLQIISYMRDGGCVIFNGDEPLLYGVIDKNHRRICCSVDNSGCCFKASELSVCDSGESFSVTAYGTEHEVHLPVSGRHYVYDAMYAIAAASVVGVDIDKAIAALASFVTEGNRQKIYRHGEQTFIADYYNASPESMAAAIELLSRCEGRHIAVLGDMLELGNYSEELHINVGKKCRECGVDVLITVGDMSRKAANESGITHFCFDEGAFAAVADKLKEIMRCGDTVLFKASNRMNLGEIIRLL